MERGGGRVAGDVDVAELELVVLGDLDPVAVAGDPAPARASSRSVWSRLGWGSITVVLP